MVELGYVEPLFEEDHGQYCSFFMRIPEYSQIHIKLMPSGKLEAEIEPSQEYPMAHLNSIHSYPAHIELETLLSMLLRIKFRCRRDIPPTCIQPRIIPPQQPTHRNKFLKIGAGLALVDLAFSDGNTTRRVAGGVLDFATKLRERKAKRKRALYKRMGWQ